MTALRDAAIQALQPITVRAPVDDAVDAIATYSADVALRAWEELLKARAQQVEVGTERVVLDVLIRVLEGRPR